jgi:polar amino acid transport system substrate-binding protein
VTSTKWILCCLLAGFAMMTSTGNASADMLSRIESAGVVRMGIPQDSPPFGIPRPDMTIVGYDIDMANLLAKKLGLRLAMVPTISGNRVPLLQSNRIDIIVASLGKNPERAKVVDFSIAYAPFFLGVYSAADVALAGPSDLAGKTIGVIRGAIEDLEVTNFAPPGTTIQRFDDAAGQASAFMAGQVNVIATSNVAAVALATRAPSRAPIMRFSIKDSPCYIGVPKGETRLLSRINEIIEEARADGTLNNMSKKWFQAELPPGF